MAIDAPQPGSHDRSTPSGTLEESAANLFEAMLAARDAEDRGESNGVALHDFYRALMTATLLLPVPPDHGDEAKAALESAVNDDAEVEISVMLAADADGQPISVCFASLAALSAWAPRGTASLPIPARIAVANMAAARVAAIMDPAGPVPYRFEADELTALAAGRLPGSGEPHLLDRALAIGPGQPAGAGDDRAGAVTGRCRWPGPMSTPPGWSTRRATGSSG